MIKKPLIVSTRGLTEHKKQSDSRQIDDDEEVIVLAYKGRKVATTIASTKPAGRNLLTTSANKALEKNLREVSMRKVWI